MDFAYPVVSTAGQEEGLAGVVTLDDGGVPLSPDVGIGHGSNIGTSHSWKSQLTDN